MAQWTLFYPIIFSSFLDTIIPYLSLVQTFVTREEKGIIKQFGLIGCANTEAPSGNCPYPYPYPYQTCA